MTTIFTDDDVTRVNAVTNKISDTQPAIARLADGGYVVSWAGSDTVNAGNEIYAQRYDASGNKVGTQKIINTYTNHDQSEPSVTGLNDGGYVITWSGDGEDGDGYGIYQQRFDATGSAVGAYSRVNTTTANDQELSAVAALHDGGYVVAWESIDQDFDGFGVYLQRFDAAGHLAGVETRINTQLEGLQLGPDVAVLTDGSYVVTWYVIQGQNGGETGIYTQMYSSNGTALGSQSRVDSDDSGSSPNIAALADGGYIVTWETGWTDQHGPELHSRRYAANSEATTSDTVLVTGSANNDRPDVTPLDDGGYVIVWHNPGHIYFQRFDATNNKVGPESSLDGGDPAIGDSAVEALADGGFVVAFATITHTLDTNINQKVVLPTANLAGDQYLYGTSAADTLDGGAGADTMSGLAGDDTYMVDNVKDIAFERPGEGNDIVLASVSYTLGLDIETLQLAGNAAINAIGNVQDNILIGNSAANVLKGLSGNDTYFVDSGDTVIEFNGQGNDTVNSAVTFSLFGAFVETLNLTGTAAIDATGNNQANTLNGNAAANTLTALGGNDTLDGKGGADTLIGGFGNDTFWVDNAGDKVIEASGQGNDTVFSTVSFSLAGVFVETLNLMGTANLNATGNSQANTLIGNDGNDILNGGYGNDSLTGGLGADTFVIGTNSGADTITDFTSSQGDLINVQAYQARHTAVITQSGNDTLIDLSGGNIITVTGATTASVQDHIVW